MATPEERRLYRTFLRRLSFRSKRYPGAFRLRNVENVPHDSESEPCYHNYKTEGGPQKLTEGGFGKVSRAKWNKPDSDKTAVVVAIKTLKVSQQPFVVSSSDLNVFLYRTPTAIRPCPSMKLLSGITSTPNMWFHFMVLQTLIILHLLFRCGWVGGVYVATWTRRRITSV